MPHAVLNSRNLCRNLSVLLSMKDNRKRLENLQRLEISTINTKLEELSHRRWELVSKKQKFYSCAQLKAPPTTGTNRPGPSCPATSSQGTNQSPRRPPSNFAKGTQQQVASPGVPPHQGPAPGAQQTTPSRPGPTVLTQPGPSGSSHTPARPKSRKKKVVCPAGNKCDCGKG